MQTLVKHVNEAIRQAPLLPKKSLARNVATLKL